MWTELVLILALTLALAYAAARVDMARIQRSARKQAEQQHIVDRLTRK